MENIAVFGGTFNPIHIGHFEMLNELNSLGFIDKIIILPSKIPPHKEVDFLALPAHRLNMCYILSKMFPKALVSDLELKREGKSYTVDTIAELKRIYPDAKLYFAVGGDMLCSFNTWKDYAEIIKNTAIISFDRGNCDYDSLISSADNLRKQGAEIIILEKEITNISSTYIRQNIQNKEILTRYIPKEILEYINKNSVYGG